MRRILNIVLSLTAVVGLVYACSSDYLEPYTETLILNSEDPRTANIVADIIIRMMPDVGALMDENSVILASGIIVERSEDVINGFAEHGFKIVERIDENGWCALAVQKA